MARLAPLPLPHDDEPLLISIELEHAIARLPERQQAVLGLRTLGYTQQAITVLLGVSRTTIWVDETEAFALLRSILDPSPVCRG